jgi:hypothetical protein
LDFSLKNFFPFLIIANQATKSNLHFSIYNENKKEINMISPNTLKDENKVYQTELVRIANGNNIGGVRTKYDGEIYQNGKTITELDYYDFYITLLEVNACLPPYTPNGKEYISPDLVENFQYDILLIMCKIGVEPKICKNNNDFQCFD